MRAPFITEEEFIENSLRTFDVICAKFFFVPTVFLFLFVVIGLFSGIEMSIEQPFVRASMIFFVVTFGVAVAGRIGFSGRVERLKVEYQEYLDATR